MDPCRVNLDPCTTFLDDAALTTLSQEPTHHQLLWVTRARYCDPARVARFCSIRGGQALDKFEEFISWLNTPPVAMSHVVTDLLILRCLEACGTPEEHVAWVKDSCVIKHVLQHLMADINNPEGIHQTSIIIPTLPIIYETLFIPLIITEYTTINNAVCDWLRRHGCSLEVKQALLEQKISSPVPFCFGPKIQFPFEGQSPEKIDEMALKVFQKSLDSKLSPGTDRATILTKLFPLCSVNLIQTMISRLLDLVREAQGKDPNLIKDFHAILLKCPPHEEWTPQFKSQVVEYIFSTPKLDQIAIFRSLPKIVTEDTASRTIQTFLKYYAQGIAGPETSMSSTIKISFPSYPASAP